MLPFSTFICKNCHFSNELQSNVYLKLILPVDRIHYFLDLLIIWNVQV